MSMTFLAAPPRPPDPANPDRPWPWPIPPVPSLWGQPRPGDESNPTPLPPPTPRVWSGATRTTVLAIGWGYLAYVLTLAIGSTVLAAIV